MDQSEDFSEWSLDQLRDRVKLVQDFDKLCDAAVAEFIYHAEAYTVVTREIMVPRTVKVLEPV